MHLRPRHAMSTTFGRQTCANVAFGSDEVLPPRSLNPVSILNRTFGSVTTGPPFPTEQSLAVRPQLSRGVHVAIQRLSADAELDAQVADIGVPPAVLRFYTVRSRVWGWFWPEAYASLRNVRFMACYHGVQYGMHATFLFGAAYCTP
jgi:hypothetical protein